MQPKVIINSISRSKISDEPLVDRALIEFSFDTPVIEYKVNVLGVSPNTGFVADAGARTVDTEKNKTVDQTKLMTVDEAMFIQSLQITLRTVEQIRTYTVDQTKLMTVDEALRIYNTGTLTAEIDWTELYQEGSNRVNIYGRNIKNEWTPYEG